MITVCPVQYNLLLILPVTQDSSLTVILVCISESAFPTHMPAKMDLVVHMSFLA
jgi:hypothetical protein